MSDDGVVWAMGTKSSAVGLCIVSEVWIIPDPTVSRKRTIQRILIIPGSCVLSSCHSTELVTLNYCSIKDLGPVSLWPHFHQPIST